MIDRIKKEIGALFNYLIAAITWCVMVVCGIAAGLGVLAVLAPFAYWALCVFMFLFFFSECKGDVQPKC